MIIGVAGNVIGGETLEDRISHLSERVLAHCEGFDPSLGYLKPELLPTRIDRDPALTGTIPEQVPFAYQDASGSRILALDGSNILNVFNVLGATWGPLGDLKWIPCSLGADSPCVTTYVPHAYATGQRVTFRLTAGGVTAGATYYARNASGVGMNVATTNSDTTIITLSGADNQIASIEGVTLNVPTDAAPVRVHQLVIYPTTNRGLTAIELDSPSVKLRPLGFKSPEDYVAGHVPGVSPTTHPQAQLFDIGATHWQIPAAVSDALKVTTDTSYTDKQPIAIGPNTPAATRIATFDLGKACTMAISGNLVTCSDAHNLQVNEPITFGSTAGGVTADTIYYVLTTPAGTTFTFSATKGGGVFTITGNIANTVFLNFTGKHYLWLHLVLKCFLTDPNSTIKSGQFVNSGTQASGFQITLHTDQACAGDPFAVPLPATVIRSYQIPQISSDGRLNLVVEALGTLSSTTVKGLSIDTTAQFTPPLNFTAGNIVGQYVLWLYSYAFSADWNFEGNGLLPAVVFSDSPWYDSLPPNPGATGNSAVVLETMTEFFADVAPLRPQHRYAYAFRGRDRLSVSQYNVMLSNPSAQTVEILADPWVAYAITVTIPSDGANANIINEYGDAATHIILYEQTFYGLGEEINGVISSTHPTGPPLPNAALGVWSEWQYIGSLALASFRSGWKIYYDSAPVGYTCTMNASTTDTVTSALHRLNVGDVISFDAITGGVTIGKPYYVAAIIDANTFYISATPRGNLACSMDVTNNRVNCTGHGLSVGQAIFFEQATGGVSPLATPYYVVGASNPNYFTFSASLGGAAVTILENGPNNASIMFAIAAGGSNTWSKEAAELTLDGYPVPQYMQVNHDVPDSAHHLMVADGRLYCFGIHWDGTKWAFPVDGAVSNYEDYGSFPGTPGGVAGESMTTDGEDLGDYAPDSMAVVALAVMPESKFILLDNADEKLLGGDANTGWDFVRASLSGTNSAKTVAVTPLGIIRHGNQSKYFTLLRGGDALPISRGQVDSSLIDFTKPHQAVFAQDKYIIFYTDSEPGARSVYCLAQYDLATRAWRRKHSAAYRFAGMCVDSTGYVYGLTYDGKVVNVFGGVVNYGDSAAVWSAKVRYLLMAAEGQENEPDFGFLNVVTDQSLVNVACTMSLTNNRVDCTAHGLSVGDLVTFGSAVGGVTAATPYYVVGASNANYFTFSATLGGGAFTVTASGANTWSVGALLTMDFYSQGKLNSSQPGILVPAIQTQTKYGYHDDINLGADAALRGDALAVQVTYTGAHPPSIYPFGAEIADAPVALGAAQ